EERRAPPPQNLYARILRMKIAEKLKLALRGNRDARMILIRDTNKLLRRFVLLNPRIGEDEVIAVTRNKSADDELLRMITERRERLLAGLLLLVPLLVLLWASVAGDGVPSGADVLFATPFFAERTPPDFTRPANPLAFDVAYQFVPWRHFAWASVRQGRLP